MSDLDLANLDLTSARDLLIALAPELVLTAAAMILLLLVAWRHRTHRDLRGAGWVSLAGLAGAGAVTWWLWWNHARSSGGPAMIAVDDFRFVVDGLFFVTAALTILVS